MKRCYIIGAGFSKACGLPLARELTGLAWNHWAEEAASDFGDDEHGPYMRKMLQHMYPSCDFKESWPDFEDMLTLLDEQELLRQAFEGKGSDRFRSKHWMKVMRTHASLAIQERTTTAKDNPNFNKVGEFVTNAHQRGDAIVSFNWDLLLECAANSKRIDIDYKGDEPSAIQMTKPHGSMNLIEDSPELGFGFSKISSSPSLRQVHEEKDRVVMCAIDPWDAHNIIRGTPEKSKVLVAPTARKVYDEHGWIGLQWKRAIRLVQDADEIIIIGFSLPDTDFRPRLLLQLACLREGHPRQPKIVLIDPKARDLTAGKYQLHIPAPIVPIESAWIDCIEDYWIE